MTNRNEDTTTKFPQTDLSAKRDFMASKMMRAIRRVTLQRNGTVALTLAVMTLISVALASAQVATEQVVPSVIKYSGVLTDADGKLLTEPMELTFALYKTERGGAALWMESQRVEPDKLGNYTVTLGSTTTAGLPSTLFAAGEARWLGVQMSGQAEQPRVMLLAVPYAMKAGDAETLGGLPASAFMQTGIVTNAVSSGTNSASASPTTAQGGLPPAASNVTTTGGTAGVIPVFTTSTNIQNSIVTQTGKTAVNVAGKLNLPSNGTATATAGKNSRPQDFVASSFSSSAGAAVAQTFQLQAEPAGNNSASPSGTLSLLFGSGTSTPAETGLKITSKGLISFATGQTFPGTGKGTITGVTAGTGLTGGGTTGNVTLTLDATKVVSGVTAGTDLTGGGTGGIVTLNVDTTKVPQLKSNNVFSGTQQLANTGIGMGPSGTSYTPLSVGTANSFGTWLAISNTSTGGHTWNIISAGGANAEGAGNLGITDLTGKSTIWLEGNTNTTNLLASASAGGSIVDADAYGANNASGIPGLRFGGASSGETIASNRNIGLNRYGLDFYTSFAPRVAITQGGQMGIATRVPHNQLDVISQSNGYAAIYAGGGSAASGSGANGGDGLDTFGGDGDTNNSGSFGGNGITAYGGGAGYWGGYGILAIGGNGNTRGGYGIWADPGNGPQGGLAGLFDGDVAIIGDLIGGSVVQKMDDPLDPANKYLSHSAVESPDMMNIYNGIATLDASGEAAITMPDWFGALNRDFRYQLTAVGAPGPNLYIAEKLANNEFKIAGGKPGMEVSWQITGIRQDAWANAHRAPVEEQKNDRERGFYLHPELYGQPEEKQIEWARHPDTARKLKQLRDSRTPQGGNLLNEKPPQAPAAKLQGN
jgi:hypothetical protein